MNKSIKLLVMTHNYPRREGDFAGVFIELLVKKLVPHGIKPIVLAPHDAGLPEREELGGVTVCRFRYASDESKQDIAYRGNMQDLVLGSIGGAFKFKHFLDSFRKSALELISKEQIDIIWGHWLVPTGIVMKTVQRKSGLPMILSSHGTDIRLMKRYATAVYRYLRPMCRSLNYWTVVSSFLRDNIISIDSGLKDILRVLPLPHNEGVFQRDDTISRDDSLIVAVTRFTRQKRVDYLVRAFDHIYKQKPETRLELFASGPLEAEIRDLVISLGLAEAVTIRPPVPQMALSETYNRASIVVLNSVDEGFGLALSEAMMCGAVAVGADSGGIRDIIEHEKTGLLVKPDDLFELTTTLNRLLDDRQLRSELAECGYQYAHATFASGPLSEKYAQMIVDVMEKYPPS